MIKLTAFALLMLVGTGISTSITMVVGGGTPYVNPLTSVGFDWCGADPCFQRIMPGKTSWEEISSLIEVDSRSLTNISGSVDDVPVVAYHSPSSPHLHAPNSVTIGWLGSALKASRVRDFVLLYGDPCAVELWQSRHFRLVFPSLLLIAETHNGRVSVNSAVQVVTINDPSEGDNCGSLIGLNRRAWAGFRWVLYYK
ncbi:MAG: hypothetical protein KF726_28780 [Anaerolineae bacterium]|nr:hypothetical protein [Anaerolineae bacterium]